MIILLEYPSILLSSYTIPFWTSLLQKYELAKELIPEKHYWRIFTAFEAKLKNYKYSDVEENFSFSNNESENYVKTEFLILEDFTEDEFSSFFLSFRRHVLSLIEFFTKFTPVLPLLHTIRQLNNLFTNSTILSNPHYIQMLKSIMKASSPQTFQVFLSSFHYSSLPSPFPDYLPYLSFFLSFPLLLSIIINRMLLSPFLPFPPSPPFLLHFYYSFLSSPSFPILLLFLHILYHSFLYFFTLFLSMVSSYFLRNTFFLLISSSLPFPFLPQLSLFSTSTQGRGK